MESLAPPLKKTRPDFLSNGGGLPSSYQAFSLPPAAGDKRLADGFTSEESSATTVGSKSKACLKFFSTSGCPYGEGCHFSHYVPGGLALLTPRKDTGAKVGLPLFRPAAPSVLPHREQELTPVGFKSRLCHNFESPEGCRFGAKCHFAHGEQDLRKPKKGADVAGKGGVDRFRSPSGVVASNRPMDEKLAQSRHREPTPPGLAAAAAASFGAVSTAKVSIDASLAGIIIGKGGINAKAISRTTGAKLFIRDHETDSSLKSVEMEGSLDQIKLASSMVRDLLANKDVVLSKPGLGPQTYKSKLCENFPKGTCTYGDRCHFAHSHGELQHQIS